MKLFVLFLLTLIVGLIHFSPHAYLWWKLYPNYTPLTTENRYNFQSYETTYAYAPEVNQILQGNRLVSDGQSYEYRNLPSPYAGETLPAILVAVLAKLSGSIDNAFIIASTLFPMLAFVLVYLILRELGSATFPAAVGSIVALIFREYLTYFPYPVASFNYFASYSSLGYLPFNRSFHPQISFTLFSLAILAFLRLVKRPTLARTIISGLTMGCLYYSYLFYWTTFLMALGILCTFLLIKKDKLLKYILLAIGTSVVMGFPYFLNVYQFQQLWLAHDFSIKSSFPAFQFFFPTIKYALMLLIFIILGFWKGNSRRFAVLLVLSALVLPSLSQIVLGRDLEGDHWISRAVLPLELLVMWTIVWERIKFIPFKVRATVLIIILLFTSGIAFWKQIKTAENTKSSFIVNLDQRHVFEYLNSHTPKDSVVGSLSFSENVALSVYTHNRLYLPRTERSLTPVDESLERFLLLSKYYQINPTDLRIFFGQLPNKLVNGTDGSGMAHIFSMSVTENDRIVVFTPEIDKRVQEQYKRILINEALGLKKYKVDFLLVSNIEKQLGHLPPDNNSVLIFENPTYSIYRVI